MKPDWTHDGLAHDLAMHVYAGGDHVVWKNIDVAGDGSRPDVFTFNKSYNAPAFVSFEVKVSVADLRSDITSGKWQKYQRFSSGVTFAIPHGLCAKSDIPDVCGLIVRGERLWRHVRRPTIAPFTMSTYMMVKLMHQGAFAAPRVKENWGDLGRYRLDEIERHALLKVGQRLGRDVAEYLRAPRSAREILAKAREEAKRVIEDAHATAEHGAARLREDYDVLAKAVGLEPGASFHAIRAELARRWREITEDSEVARLVDWFKAQRRVCDTALAPYERKAE